MGRLFTLVLKVIALSTLALKACLDVFPKVFILEKRNQIFPYFIKNSKYFFCCSQLCKGIIDTQWPESSP